MSSRFPTAPALAAVMVLIPAVCAAERRQPLPKVPAGFTAELVLGAPDIEAPTALCVAPNGDVYYAEDPMDMRGPPTKNIDTIWMLKGGDPKKKVKIAENMWAVMGLEVVRDKLYVVHAPHVTVFTLDSEGKPVDRKELFDDLGPPVAGAPSFNDHIPSGIRMGTDGWLYVSIGDKGIPKMTRKETDRGSVHVAEGRWRFSKNGRSISLEGGGVIRFRPDGGGLEVYASGTRNHLDVPLDRHDRVFVRDNTDDGLGWNTRLMYLPRHGFMGYPWAYTKHPRETVPMIHDFGGGSPCGGWVYHDDGLPETYRGRVFHCEWGKGKVFAVKLAPDGAGFKFVDEVVFMDPEGTGLKDFRPFTLRPTADGRGFYVTDWGHSGWLSPTKAGRLWKVTYTGTDVTPAPRGKESDSLDDLVKALNHPALSERLRAQRALVARGDEASRLLENELEEKRLKPLAHAHALWVLRDTDPTEAVKWAALGTIEKDDDLRLEATRVVASFDDSPVSQRSRTLALEALGGRLGDPNPQIRLQAAGGGVFRYATKLLARAAAGEQDRIVRHVLAHTLRDSIKWGEFEILTKEQLTKTFADHPAELRRFLDVVDLAFAEEFKVTAVEWHGLVLSLDDPAERVRAIESLSRVYFDRTPYAGTWWGTQPAGHKPPPRDVAWEGTPAVRKLLLKALSDPSAAVRTAAVDALAAAGDQATLEPLTSRFGQEKNDGTKADIVRAVAALHSAEAVGFLAGVLKNGSMTESTRIEAVAGLEAIHDPRATDQVGQAAADAGSANVRIRALKALGTMKAAKYAAVCTAALTSENPGTVAAAATSLGQMGDPKLAAPLIPLVKSAAPEVRTAAIAALGWLRNHDAVPALIDAAGHEPTSFEAVKALAEMPDRRALSVYLTGLTSKSPELRAGSAAAVGSLRDLIAPDLEQLAARNELTPHAVTALRDIYAGYVPVLAWRLIGPFPNDGKEYVEDRAPGFDRPHTGAEKTQVSWHPIKADPAQHGRVNLLNLLRPNQDVTAYASATIESAADRDAHLLVGSDDSITIWLNGSKVHDQPSDRGWGFDSDKVPVKLRKGANHLFLKCGQHGGGWDFSVAVPGDPARFAFLRGGSKKLNLDDFRAFARMTPGDPGHGKKLFFDLKGLACVKCHAVGGQGGRVGPGLDGIALKYKREDLMTSVLEPSKTIANGYETIVITTAKGKILTGVFKGETGDRVEVMDNEGKLHAVLKSEIEERAFSPVSTMPNGLGDGMSLQDFADLIAYLEARREDQPGGKK